MNSTDGGNIVSLGGGGGGVTPADLAAETAARIAGDATNATAAAAAQSTANAAMPKAGGTFTGNVTLQTTKKLLAGANELIGAIADKLNAVHLAFTGQTVGDQMVADSTTTFARVAAAASGKFWRAAGVGVAPAWSTLTIPDTVAQGTVLVASAANVVSALAAQTINNFLIGNGTDVISATPAQARTALGIDDRYGTYASIGSAATYPKTLYYVDSGAGRGDVYQSTRTGSGSYVWKLIYSDQLGALSPLYYWPDDEQSGTTLRNTGSGSSADMTITGTVGLARYAGNRRGVLWPSTNATYATCAAAATSSTRIVTLACWYTPTALVAGGTSYVLLRWARTSGASTAIGLLTDDVTAGRLRVAVTTDGTTSCIWRETDTALVAGAAHHIVVVWDGNQSGAAKIAMYVNGAPLAGGSWTSTPSTDLAYGTGAWITGINGAFPGSNGVLNRRTVLDGVALTQESTSSVERRRATS